MSNLKLRQTIVGLLKNQSEGMDLDQLESAVRKSGFTFDGIAAFALLGILRELEDQGFARSEKNKYKLVPGRTDKVPERPKANIKSRNLRVLMLAKKWTKNKEDQDELADGIQAMVDAANKPKVVLVEETKDGFQVEIKGEITTGKTIIEALGNLLVLQHEKLGLDLQAR